MADLAFQIADGLAVLVGELNQNVLDIAVAGRHIVDGRAVLHVGAIAGGRIAVGGHGALHMGVVGLLQLFLAYGHILDGLIAHLLQHLGVRLAFHQFLPGGVGKLRHLGLHGRIQLLAFQLRIGKIGALDAVGIEGVGAVHRFLHLGLFLVTEHVQAQVGGLFLQHGLLHHGVDGAVLSHGNGARIRAVIGNAIHGIHVFFVIHHGFNLLVDLGLGKGLAHHLDDGGLLVHFLVLDDEGAAAGRHQGEYQHEGQNDTLAHGNFSPIL